MESNDSDKYYKTIIYICQIMNKKELKLLPICSNQTDWNLKSFSLHRQLTNQKPGNMSLYGRTVESESVFFLSLLLISVCILLVLAIYTWREEVGKGNIMQGAGEGDSPPEYLSVVGEENLP